MKPFIGKLLQPKGLIAMVLIACALIGSGNLMRSGAVAVNGSNDIISDGASSPTDLINKIHLDSSTGKYGGDLAAIYANTNYKLPASEYNRFIASAKAGTVYQDGHVVVDGRTVATNGITLSRNTTNPTNHTPITIGGTTYSEVALKYTMTSTQLDTMVLFDAQGNTQTVVLNICGNPLRITPNNPVHSCDALNVSGPVDRTTFNFTSNITANNGSTLNKLVYDFGDGTTPVESTDTTKVISHTYATEGSYSAKLTVYVNVPGSQVYTIAPAGSCIKSVTVAPAPAPKAPHVSITKTVGPNNQETLEVAKDGTFSYTVTAKNDGEVDLKNVVISDPAKTGIQFLSAKTGSTDIPVTGNKISYSVPTLAVDQSVSITITAKSNAVSTTPVVNQACVETPTIPATNPDACDTASTTTPEPPVVKVPHVVITKTVGPNDQETLEVQKDAEFTYTLKVTNDGEVDLKNVVVSDPAQTGIQFVSAKTGSTNIAVDGNKIAYTIPSLAVDQFVTITITAKATQYAASPVINTACVNAPEVNPSEPNKNDSCDTASTTTPQPHMVSVCDATTGDIRQVPEADKDKYEDVNSAKCKVQVCDSSDHIVKFVPKADASKYLPGDSNVCVKIAVCVIKSGDTATTSIYKDQLDTTKQSTKASDCVKPETPVTPVTQAVAPAAIASAGPEAILGGISSASALTYGAYTYAASRRAVRNAHK